MAKKPKPPRHMPRDVRYLFAREALEKLMGDLEGILLDDVQHIVRQREKSLKRQKTLSPVAQGILAEATVKQLKILRASGKEVTDVVWRHGVETLRLLYGNDAIDEALKEMRKKGH